MIGIASRNKKKLSVIHCMQHVLMYSCLVFLDHDVLRHQRIICHKTEAENASL